MFIWCINHCTCDLPNCRTTCWQWLSRIELKIFSRLLTMSPLDKSLWIYYVCWFFSVSLGELLTMSPSDNSMWIYDVYWCFSVSLGELLTMSPSDNSMWIYDVYWCFSVSLGELLTTSPSDNSMWIYDVYLGDNTFVIEWFAGINYIILWSQI